MPELDPDEASLLLDKSDDNPQTSMTPATLPISTKPPHTDRAQMACDCLLALSQWEEHANVLLNKVEALVHVFHRAYSSPSHIIRSSAGLVNQHTPPLKICTVA